LVATPADGAGTAPLFRVDLPPEGAERTVELDLPGVVAVRAEPSTPALGWIVVQGHPYYAITDADGAFRLDDIPPGTYRLRAWIPPLDPSSADPRLAQPVTRVRSVVVRDRAVTPASLTF
jgi:hypothetical protein